MVGGLVEQQQFGVGDQRACQQGAALEAAGETGEFQIGIKLQARQGGFHALFPEPAVATLEFVLCIFKFVQGSGCRVMGDRDAGGVVARQYRCRFAEPPGHHVEQIAVQISGHVLGQPCAAQALASVDVTGVGEDLLGDEFQQGRLAGAVAADQADALTRFQTQVDAVQQRVSTEVEQDVTERD